MGKSYVIGFHVPIVRERLACVRLQSTEYVSENKTLLMVISGFMLHEYHPGVHHLL